MRTTGYNPQISDLRELAVAVVRDAALPTPEMSARTAARCLSGVVNLIAQRWSVSEMQLACGMLARHRAAWTTQFGQLPTGDAGDVRESVQLLAVIARGILPLAGVANMRAALAFWACESDPAVWSTVTGS